MGGGIGVPPAIDPYPYPSLMDMTLASGVGDPAPLENQNENLQNVD